MVVKNSKTVNAEEVQAYLKVSVKTFDLIPDQKFPDFQAEKFMLSYISSIVRDQSRNGYESGNLPGQ